MEDGERLTYERRIAALRTSLRRITEPLMRSGPTASWFAPPEEQVTYYRATARTALEMDDTTWFVADAVFGPEGP